MFFWAVKFGFFSLLIPLKASVVYSVGLNKVYNFHICYCYQVKI